MIDNPNMIIAHATYQFTQALSDVGAGIGGTVVVVSQGKTTSLGLNEEKELTDLAAKHRLKIFSVAIPRQPQVGQEQSMQ